MSLILAGHVSRAFALNADSLGGNPWTAYLRSNAADTVNGPLWINLCKYAQFTADPNKYGMYWDNHGMASVRAVNYARGGWGILANHHGIDNGVDTASYWLEVRCDSTGGGIKIEGQQKAIFPIKVNNPSKYGAGLGVFTDEGSGIYIDHGGSPGDPNSKAMFIENNYSSIGYGLYMLAAQGSKGRMLWYEDRGTGRMMRTQQYDQLRPSLTVVYKDTNGVNKADSSMYYWWGLKARKVVADTFYGAFVGNIQNVVTLAKNSDSLGGVAAKGYLRSNVQDTATGNLYLNNVKWLFQANDSLSGYGQQWQNYGLASLYSVNYNPGGTSILGVNKGIDNNVDKRSFWMTIRSDSSGGAIRMFGNSKANQIMVVEGVSPSGSGIGIYNQQGTGLYVSHSGDGRGIAIQNGLQSTGTGLRIDNQNTGTALYVADTKSGRMIVTSQDLADKPAITVGYKFGQTFHDSAMLYHWGLRSKKVVADTLWGRFIGTSDSAVISGRTNLLKTGMEYQSGDKFLRTDKTDTARFVVFDSIKAGKIVDLNVANSTNANYLLYGSSFYSGTSYLRSDAADTANGPLWINLCKYAQFTTEPNKYGMYWDNYGMASVRAVNYARGGWGILANHHGIDDGEDTASFWLEVRCDSTGGGIKIEGQQKAIFPIKVNNPSKYGAGLGVFTDEGSGIYIDHGGSTGDTNSKAMFIENNWSSVGYGLSMIAAQGSKGRMLWYEDRGTG
ncbi:MAG: hypothetical protein Q7U71_04565, partial [bacterium]|nr:hypothetical protein [bacterium]